MPRERRELAPQHGRRRERIGSELQLRELLDSIQVPRELLHRKLPEWKHLEKAAIDSVAQGRVEILDWVADPRYELPLVAMSFGTTDPEAPVLGLYGGVHGLERIGAQVVLSLLSSFSELLLWDRLLQESLARVRVVFFPLVNPWGAYHKWRSNPNGVDLMRNAPVDSTENPTWLVGGHRISPQLPWYRGPAGAPMEREAQALVTFTREQTGRSKRVVTLDFHSGFGTADQIWFPYAKSAKPFPHLPELYALKEAFERTHPHHFYKIEPQAKHYTTHGDLWDYLYDLYLDSQPEGVYLPLTVEMGSWLWVKKNPSQILSPLGPYNPIAPHRHKRILRRHNTLFDFLIRSLVSHPVWTPSHAEQIEKHRTRALELWYGRNED